MFQRRAEWKKKDLVERVVGRRTWCCLRRLRLLSLANGAGRREDATGVGELPHGIHSSMKATLACHQARSTE